MQAGSQVSLEYDINLSLTQIPENLIFYSDSARTNAIYKENGAIHLEGYFNQATANKTESRTLYWEWPMETGSTQNQINENDMLDSNWIGERIVLAVSAKGRQVTEENLTQQYAVTFDANGGTINGYGNSSQATKMVTYGETYGALPTPTREGYTFMGWNGKNLFTGLTKGIKLNSNVESVNFGQEVSTPESATSDFINVNFNNSNGYYLSGLTNTLNSCVYAYNENKECLGRTSGTSAKKRILKDNSFSIGSGLNGEIKYIKISQYETADTNGIIDDIDNLLIQLEVGEIATAYEPYYITSSTEVVQNQNHTLTAIWEPKSN